MFEYLFPTCCKQYIFKRGFPNEGAYGEMKLLCSVQTCRVKFTRTCLTQRKHLLEKVVPRVQETEKPCEMHQLKK